MGKSFGDFVLQMVESGSEPPSYHQQPSIPHAGRQRSPFRITLRPGAFNEQMVLAEPTLEARPAPPCALVRIAPLPPLVPYDMVPPEPIEATFEEEIPVEVVEEELVGFTVRKPRHPHIKEEMVRNMVLMAECQRLTEDQPYMPFPCTTLREAVRHLRVNKCLGVYGGHIVINRGKVVYRMLEMYDGKRNYTLTPDQLLTVLRLNYPLRYQGKTSAKARTKVA